MDQSWCVPQPWWRRWIVDWRFRPEDENQELTWWVKFLNFSAWSMMTFEFGIDFDFGVNGGRLAVHLPYMMFAIGLLPILDTHHKTWRRTRFPRGWEICQRRDSQGNGIARFDLYDDKQKNIGFFETKQLAIKWAIKHGRKS